MIIGDIKISVKNEKELEILIQTIRMESGTLRGILRIMKNGKRETTERIDLRN